MHSLFPIKIKIMHVNITLLYLHHIIIIITTNKFQWLLLCISIATLRLNLKYIPIYFQCKTHMCHTLKYLPYRECL